MAVFFNGIRALGHFVRCDTCPMLKKTVVPTCSNITEKKNEFCNASWESNNFGNSFGQITGSHFRHPTEIDRRWQVCLWPPGPFHRTWNRKRWYLDPRRGCGTSVEHPWNIRILKCFRRVHEGFLCRYMSLLYVTVCHRSFIMFHHVFGSQVASTLLSFCVEGTSFGTGLGPRNTGKQDRSDRMRSGAHAKATSNVSVASAASAAASQVADLIFMDHHGSSWIIMNHVTMSCPDAGFSYLVFQDLNVF